MAEHLHQEKWEERRRRLEAILSRADLNQQQHDPPQPDNILHPLLYWAAKGADVDEFIGHLENHCIRDRVSLPIVLGLRSPLGNTLLHAAAENDDNVTAIIDFVPKQLISCKNSKGETPLHIAARAGRSGAVELLLPWGNSTCTDHSGNSALHEAVRNCHGDVIRRLVRGDPNPLYRQNKESKSPWCVAVETGNVDVLNELLEVTNDGEDQRRSETKEVFGMSPVHVAITHKNMDMLQVMRQRKPWLFQLRDSGGGTPLHLAAYINYLEGVRSLMQHYQTDALEQDNTDGYLPIHVACMMGHIEIVHELLQLWLDPAEFLTRLGQNILHVSAQHGQTAIVRYILNDPSFDHLINARDLEGNTPLHVAALHYQPSIMHLAHERRIDLSLVNNNNMTALDVVERDIKAIDDLLLKKLMRMILGSVGTPRSKELAICEPTGRSPRKRLGPSDPNVVKDQLSSLLVVATLIASVTFVSGFSVPGGYYGSDTNAGLPALLHNAMYNVFVISNSTAMYSSIITIVMLLWTIVYDPSVKGAALTLTTIPLLVALAAIPLAFMAGVYGTVTKLDWLSRIVVVHGSIALFIILDIVVLLYFPLVGSFTYQLVYLALLTARRETAERETAESETAEPPSHIYYKKMSEMVPRTST